MTKKILILGGTGVLGYAICKELLEQGHILYVFNRGTNNHRLPRDSIWIQGDRRNILDLDKLRKIDFNIIIDTMGWYHETLPKIFDLFSERIEKYIFISSVSVYGGSSTKEFCEDEDIFSMPISINKSLCEEKRACEKVCQRYYSDGFPITVLRLSHLLGYKGIVNREKLLLNSLLRNKIIYLPDGGSARLQFIHIQDVIDVCKDIVEDIANKYQAHSSYNVTSKYVWSIIDWVQKCAACLNVIARMESRPFNYNNSNDFIYWPSDIIVNNARIEMLKGNISEFSDLWIHELI